MKNIVGLTKKVIDNPKMKITDNLGQALLDKITELKANQASYFLKFVKSSDKIGNIAKLQFHDLFVVFKQAGDL